MDFYGTINQYDLVEDQTIVELGPRNFREVIRSIRSSTDHLLLLRQLVLKMHDNLWRLEKESDERVDVECRVRSNRHRSECRLARESVFGARELDGFPEQKQNPAARISRRGSHVVVFTFTST